MASGAAVGVPGEEVVAEVVVVVMEDPGTTRRPHIPVTSALPTSRAGGPGSGADWLAERRRGTWPGGGTDKKRTGGETTATVAEDPAAYGERLRLRRLLIRAAPVPEHGTRVQGSGLQAADEPKDFE